MGPLQYMVVGYERDYFRDEVLPELSSLSKRHVIRVIDVVFVTRNRDGAVQAHELSETMPEHSNVISAHQENIFESFTQDDIDVIGHELPDGASAALVLLEHCWADRLEQAVTGGNRFLDRAGSPAGTIALALEHRLARGLSNILVEEEIEFWPPKPRVM